MGKRKRSLPASTLKTASGKTNFGCLALGALFGVFPFAIGSFLFYVTVIEPYLTGRRAMDWIETPCEVVHANVREDVHTTSNRGPERSTTTSTTYELELAFRYEFDGKEYVSQRYDFTNIGDGYSQWREDVADRYQPGTQTVCYVNPDDPAEAVIERSSQVHVLTALVPVAAILMGLGVWFVTFYAIRSTTRRAPSPSG